MRRVTCDLCGRIVSDPSRSLKVDWRSLHGPGVDAHGSLTIDLCPGCAVRTVRVGTVIATNGRLSLCRREACDGGDSVDV